MLDVLIVKLDALIVLQFNTLALIYVALYYYSIALARSFCELRGHAICHFGRLSHVNQNQIGGVNSAVSMIASKQASYSSTLALEEGQTEKFDYSMHFLVATMKGKSSLEEAEVRNLRRKEVPPA